MPRPDCSSNGRGAAVVHEEDPAREAHARLQRMLAGLPILVAEVDVHRRRAVCAGGRLAERFRCTPDGTEDLLAHVHGEDEPRVTRVFDQLRRHASPEELHGETCDIRLSTADGTTAWVRFYFSEVTQRAPLCFSCVGVDVTREVQARQERERLERELEEARGRLQRALVTGLDLGVGQRPVHVHDAPSPAVASGTDLGVSQAMEEVRQLAAIASRHEEPVLLLGETGTGKGVLAERIHAESARRDRPFVALNCSSLGGDMLESELFGHARGAFTSAVRHRTGLVEEAHGGTLFLDEIGEMGPSVQAKLLRVLEDKAFRRLGESTERRSDFRLVCATHRDLWADVKSGRFRADLLFRINVLPIPIPPLRRRREDIPFLARRILESVNAAHVRLSDEALAVLGRYPWPGNIRELRNALIRATLLSHDAVLRPKHFTDLMAGPMDLGPRRSSRPPPPDADPAERIRSLLARFDGNRSKVARTLGISRTTLYRRMRELGIPPRAGGVTG